MRSGGEDGERKLMVRDGATMGKEGGGGMGHEERDGERGLGIEKGREDGVMGERKRGRRGWGKLADGEARRVRRVEEFG